MHRHFHSGHTRGKMTNKMHAVLQLITDELFRRLSTGERINSGGGQGVPTAGKHSLKKCFGHRMSFFEKAVGL